MSSPSEPAFAETDGGQVARRAVIRWGIRLFRAEWRQQLVVLSLLTVAVAAAVAVATAVHVVTPAVEDATFGAATHRYTLDNVNPADIDATIDAANDWFAEVETIRRGEIRVDGRGDAIAARVQDPADPLSAPMLALLTGRTPPKPVSSPCPNPWLASLVWSWGRRWRSRAIWR